MHKHKHTALPILILSTIKVRAKLFGIRPQILIHHTQTRQAIYIWCLFLKINIIYTIK